MLAPLDFPRSLRGVVSLKLSRLSALCLSVLAAAAIVVGCGDDESSGSGSDGSIATSSLSKEQFVKKVTELCNKGREDVPQRATAYQEKNPPGKGSAAEYRAKAVQAVLLPMLEEEIAKIREIGAPEGEEEQVEAMLGAQQQGVDEVAALDSLEPREGVMEAYFAEATRAMNDYGLEECAVK
jgi:hypothetical protein